MFIFNLFQLVLKMFRKHVLHNALLISHLLFISHLNYWNNCVSLLSIDNFLFLFRYSNNSFYNFYWNQINKFWIDRNMETIQLLLRYTVRKCHEKFVIYSLFSECRRYVRESEITYCRFDCYSIIQLICRNWNVRRYVYVTFLQPTIKNFWSAY